MHAVGMSHGNRRTASVAGGVLLQPDGLLS